MLNFKATSQLNEEETSGQCVALRAFEYTRYHDFPDNTGQVGFAYS